MAKLVLVRHGQSVWNQLNEFTGWVDVPLTKQGDVEARNAGQRLAQVPFDIAFTSQLIRAHQTLCAIFQERTDRILIFKHKLGKAHLWQHYSNAKTWEVPVFKAQALNERYYGDLQGLNKEETARKYGADQVHVWRRSFDVAPPNGESLQDVTRRTIPYFDHHIMPFLKQGKNVIVVAHGNSLRSIIMHIEQLLPNEIMQLELGTGVPICYDIDERGLVLRKEVLK